MNQPVPIPGLLICQPAIVAPAQLDFALGMQHLWTTELSKLGLSCRPTVLSRPHPEDPSRRQPIFHHSPYALETVEQLNAEQLPGMPRMALQSQVLLASDPLCYGHARLGNIRERRDLDGIQSTGGMGVLLRWVYEVVDEVAVRMERDAPHLRWQAEHETTDPQEASFQIGMRGAVVRELLGLDAEPIPDEAARAQYRATLN